MLNVKNVSFGYDTTPVLKNISFTIKKGQHIAVIGASGCGKSTLLKVIYGLLNVDEGSLFWDDKQILGPAYNLVPGETYMKHLSQGSELQSFQTVAENIGQYLSNFEHELKRGRVYELLDIVEMTAFAQTKVENLSGGQRQRVALAKVLAKKPELLLLDEPFGNIDNFRRSSLRRNLFDYLKRNKITSITATHDKTDILSFADETIVIKEGELISKKVTSELYRHPENYYVASLFGEVNQLRLSRFFSNYDMDKHILVYPYEVFVNPVSDIRAIVKKSHFQGSHYLIEAILDSQIIFLEHKTHIVDKEEIGIQISPEAIDLRG